MADSRKYGLIIPKKSSSVTKTIQPKPSIFGNDSDQEDSGINESLKKEALKSKMKRQTQLEIQKALKEDPTVYEYDSIYDEIEQSKKEAIVKKKEDKDRTPKYINCLLKTAEKRKKDNELRLERKVQKEREEEGEMFAEKEKFVTSAYKQKMEAMAEAQEHDRQMEQLEAMMDVTKQKDLSGFYRHLLKQTTGEQVVSSIPEGIPKIKTEYKLEPEKSGDDGSSPSVVESHLMKQSKRKTNSSDDDEDSERLKKLALFRKKSNDNLKCRSDMRDKSEQESPVRSKDNTFKAIVKNEDDMKKTAKRSYSDDSDYEIPIEKSKDKKGLSPLKKIQDSRSYRKRQDSDSDENEDYHRKDKGRRNENKKHNESSKNIYEDHDELRRNKSSNHHLESSHKSKERRGKEERDRLSSKSKSRDKNTSLDRDIKDKGHYKDSEINRKQKDDNQSKKYVKEQMDVELQDKTIVEGDVLTDTVLKPSAMEMKNIFARRNDNASIQDAKERFLARKLAKMAEKTKTVSSNQ